MAGPLDFTQLPAWGTFVKNLTSEDMLTLNVWYQQPYLTELLLEGIGWSTRLAVPSWLGEPIYCRSLLIWVNRILAKNECGNISGFVKAFTPKERQRILDHLNSGSDLRNFKSFRSYKIEIGSLGLIKIEEFIAFSKELTIWGVLIKDRLYQKLIQGSPSPWFLVENFTGDWLENFTGELA